MHGDPILFHNKYRIPSARRQGWDYGSSGWYFVTICTKGKEYYLGDIIGNRMRLSSMGRIAKQCWQQIPNHFSHVALDAFVIMPNHVHGVIVINEPRHVETLQCNVSTQRIPSPMSIISPRPGSLPTIMRSFKSITARIIHDAGIPQFQWQPRYHDRIIRDAKALEQIRWYIQNNPRMWKRDRNHVTCRRCIATSLPTNAP